MSKPIVKSLIDEQVEDAEQRVQVRGVVQLTRTMLVADLKHPIKADWLKRSPMPRPTPCQ
jgi:hypothetical protein